RLRQALGKERVLTHLATLVTEDRAAASESLRAFSDEAGPRTLVCDSSGEEGLNLQFADLLIHFDLPWEPNRIEQRIGRLDRIGRTGEVKMRAFVGPECDHSLHEAWFE